MKNIVLGAIACVIATGCATYKGEKLGVLPDSKGDPIVVAPDGVPYMLTRPVYSLTRSVGADSSDPIYTLAVANEPDPKQMYSIRLKTAPFTDPDFLVKLGAGGVLSSTTSSTSQTLTPAIAAIGSFASNLLGAKAFGVFDKTDIKSLIEKAVKNATEIADCKQPPNLANYKDAVTLQNISVHAIADQLIAYMAEFDTDKDFISEFHYRTSSERECLKKIRNTMDDQDSKETKVRMSDWKTAEDIYFAENKTDPSFAYKLRAAVQSRESTKLTAIKTEIQSLKDAALATKQDYLYSKASLAMTASIFADTAKQVAFFVEMDDTTWRARHVVYLERKQSDLQLLRIRDPSVVTNEEKASAFNRWSLALEQERSQTLGVASLYARSQMLAEFLTRIREKAVDGGRAPATAEYATIRQELDAILTAIEAKRSKLMADAAPPPTPKLPPLNNVPVQVVSLDVITASKADGWVQSPAGQDAAPFVIVLKEAK